MFTAQRVLKKCHALAAGSLILLGVALSSPAQASLIGYPVSYPDLTVSALDLSFNGTALSASSNSSALMDLFLPGTPSAIDLWLNGSYLLQYDFASHIGTLSISGTYDGTSDPFSLHGFIVRAGAGADGKAYDFLVQLDAIDPTLTDYGFGPLGSVIYTDVMRNGSVWQSDTASTAVPEPSTLILLAAGLCGVALLRRRYV
jgi:hypothetical protein